MASVLAALAAKEAAERSTRTCDGCSACCKESHPTIACLGGCGYCSACLVGIGLTNQGGVGICRLGGVVALVAFVAPWVIGGFYALT